MSRESGPAGSIEQKAKAATKQAQDLARQARRGEGVLFGTEDALAKPTPFVEHPERLFTYQEVEAMSHETAKMLMDAFARAEADRKKLLNARLKETLGLWGGVAAIGNTALFLSLGVAARASEQVGHALDVIDGETYAYVSLAIMFIGGALAKMGLLGTEGEAAPGDFARSMNQYLKMIAQVKAAVKGKE